MYIILVLATVLAFMTLMVKIFSKEENPFYLLDCHPGNASTIYVVCNFITCLMTAASLCLYSVYLFPLVPLFAIFAILYNFDAFTINLKSTIKRKLQNFLKDDEDNK